MTGPSPIFDAVERDVRHAEHAFTGWFHRDHYQTPADQPATPAAPAARPEETPMSVITDFRNDITAAAHDLAAKAAELEQQILPAAASKLTVLEGNPVVDALLNAVHVPPERLGIVVALINDLEDTWNPPQDAQPQAPAGPQQPAQPAQDAQQQPAPAGQ